MIVGNYSVYLKSPARWLAGNATAANAHPKAREVFGRFTDWKKFGLPDHSGAVATVTNLLACKPTGYYPQGSWALPVTAGELSSHTLLAGEAACSASGALGRNAAAELTASGDITLAELILVVQAYADLTASGDLAGDILGKLEASAALSGAGTLEGDLDALGWIASALAGGATVAADLEGQGNMAADIRSYGDLTPENLANKVWNYLVEGNWTALQELRLLTAVAVGKTDIATGPPVVVTFRDIGDTKDRVTAEMDGSERVDITLDGE